ncbi:MAG: glutathione-dependent formaldehyde dehydrogenase, partial [Opitutaceae bacterium]|nr:glutathione-dependent formaldehyde dehydrogenase [Opitutaceae bacterium]
MQRYLRPLLERVEKKQIDPSCIITHRVPLTQAAEAYAMFAEKTDGCIKVVLDPSR